MNELPKPEVSASADVRSWWATNPMTYGELHGRDSFGDGSFETITAEYFERLDREFYYWNRPLHAKSPFDRLFPYERYAQNRPVLEVGCGLGTMAMNWARHGADIHALDLNPTSVIRTNKRFDLLGISPKKIIQGDGRFLPFPDRSFDYVYSWGVLHHSPNLEESLCEMMRVLKPGGGFGVMLYHRRSLLHWYMTCLVQGYLNWESRFLSPLALASRYGDGDREEGNPHTWPVTKDEMRSMIGRFSGDLQFRVLGTDLEHIFNFMLPGIGSRLPRVIIRSWARRFGWSLWSYGHKNAE